MYTYFSCIMNRILQRDLTASLNPRKRFQTHSKNTRWSFLSRGHNLSPLVRCPRVLLQWCCPCYYKKNKRTHKTMTKLKPNSVRALYEVDYKCSCQPSHQKIANVRCPRVSTQYKDEQGSEGTHTFMHCWRLYYFKVNGQLHVSAVSPLR
jgi:hypothetical protein